MKNLRLITSFLLLLLAMPELVNAQNDDQSGNSVAPYYVDFNSAEKTFIYDLRGDYLHVQYNDIYGKEKSIPISIFNWKRELVAQIMVDKQFGLNYFDIKLKEHAIQFNINETYVCQLTDEVGKKYEVNIKYLPLVKRIITAGIFVRPMYLQCDDPTEGNLVEFYGNIEGGKAPYTINWYVMNKQRTDFLYQPKLVTMKRPGYTSSIQVDKSPEYFVLLYVKDACGNEQTSTVQMTCEGNKKKINTVFLQPLFDGAPTATKFHN